MAALVSAGAFTLFFIPDQTPDDQAYGQDQNQTDSDRPDIFR